MAALPLFDHHLRGTRRGAAPPRAPLRHTTRHTNSFSGSRTSHQRQRVAQAEPALELAEVPAAEPVSVEEARRWLAGAVEQIGAAKARPQRWSRDTSKRS